MLRRLGPALLLPVLLPLLVLQLFVIPAAGALAIPPPPPRRINDYAGVLAPADRDRLEQALTAR